MDVGNKVLELDYGYHEDKDILQLKNVLKNNTKLKELCIDIYSENPAISVHPSMFMLLLRTFEKDVLVSNNEDRVILKKNDRDKTYIMNILFSKIKWCFYKTNDNFSEFIFNIQNTYYKLIIFN